MISGASIAVTETNLLKTRFKFVGTCKCPIILKLFCVLTREEGLSTAQLGKASEKLPTVRDVCGSNSARFTTAVLRRSTTDSY